MEQKKPIFSFAGFRRKTKRRTKTGIVSPQHTPFWVNLISHHWQWSQYLFVTILGVKLHPLSRAGVAQEEQPKRLIWSCTSHSLLFMTFSWQVPHWTNSIRKLHYTATLSTRASMPHTSPQEWLHKNGLQEENLLPCHNLPWSSLQGTWDLLCLVLSSPDSFRTLDFIKMFTYR